MAGDEVVRMGCWECWALWWLRRSGGHLTVWSTVDLWFFPPPLTEIAAQTRKFLFLPIQIVDGFFVFIR